MCVCAIEKLWDAVAPVFDSVCVFDGVCDMYAGIGGSSHTCMSFSWLLAELIFSEVCSFWGYLQIYYKQSHPGAVFHTA